jgi:tetratricopeptide (TPR) repeat protein
VDPTPSGDRRPGDRSKPRPVVQQTAAAYDAARQAVLGSGTQNVFWSGRERSPEPAVSIAPPVGQRDESLPIRGRHDLLAELAGTGARVRVLHGLGGCGKTRLALEVAYTAQQHGIEVWWVPAAQPDALAAGMRAVGRRLGVSDDKLEHGDAADVIWQRLTDRHTPWLLVIDNADDSQVLAGAGTSVAEGRGWLRPVDGEAGAVLVTSRDGSPASWASWCRRHRLEMLPADPAAAVLADHAGHHPGLGSDEDARMMAARLGGLPLALKIAGSYLAEAAAIPAAFADSGLIRTYRQYMDALQGGDLEALFPVPGGQLTAEQARGLIGRTWELTLERLDARQLPEARRVLQLLAVFADAPLPYELLLSPKVLAKSSLFPEISGARLWQVISTLDDFGLLELRAAMPELAGIGVAQLHPLVRDTSRSVVDSKRRVMFLELASRLLEQAVRGRVPENPVTWPIYQLLAPHIEGIFESLAREPGCSDRAAESAALSAYTYARYLSKQGLKTQAETLFRVVLEAQTRILGADNPSTLNTRFHLAREVAARGDHAAAEAEHRAVLEALTRILGADNPSTLRTRHELAHEVAARGDHASAEAEHRVVLEAETRILGADFPSTLRTRHCLAHEVAARGDHAAAEAEHRAVLEAETRILGAEDLYTLVTRRCLAGDIAARGDHPAAEAEYRAVLEAHTRILGADNPSTLNTRIRLAGEIAARGDHPAAEAEYRAVLEAETRILGADNPSTLNTRIRLAGEIAARRDHPAAEAEYRAVLEAQTRILGADNPSTLKTRHCLAHAIAALGDHATAEAEYRAVLEAQTRILGADYPSTLNTRHSLAHAIAALGDHAAAEAEHHAVLEAQTRVLGADNPSTLTTRGCLAGEIAGRGDHAAAEAEYRAVLEAETRVLGADYPSTLTTRYRLAGEIAARGDHATAEAEYRAVLEAETRVLGADSLSTLRTRRRLAEVCQLAGRPEEANSLYQSLLADCERSLGADHSLTRTIRSKAADAASKCV